MSADTAYVLVGHSGAGALLPAIREVAGFVAAGYIFVDAGLPQGDMSQIDGPFGPQLRAIYGSGQGYPNWSDADLSDAIPDRDTRQRLLQQVRPQPLRFWKETIPVFDGWPDAPCGYLRFSLNSAYEGPATEAQRRGWLYAQLAGDHFHMLVDPIAVTDALLGLSQGMLIWRSSASTRRGILNWPGLDEAPEVGFSCLGDARSWYLRPLAYCPQRSRDSPRPSSDRRRQPGKCGGAAAKFLENL